MEACGAPPGEDMVPLLTRIFEPAHLCTLELCVYPICTPRLPPPATSPSAPFLYVRCR